MNMKRIILLILVAAPGLSAGQGAPLTWTLLGPAVSKHAQSDDGYIVEPARGYWQCNVTSATGRDCVGVVTPPKVGWNEQNDAIGLEVSRVDALGQRDSLYVNLVRDSYRELGLMAGMGRTWPAGQVGTLRLEFGFAAGLWARTVAVGTKPGGLTSYCYTDHFSETCDTFPNSAIPANTYQVTDLRRAVVPFVFPLFSVTETKTGLGLRAALAPPISVGAYQVVPTTTFMLQATYKF